MKIKICVLYTLILLGALLPLHVLAQVVYSPSTPHASSANQIVGANFQNTSASTQPAHVVQLGQAFVEGALSGNSGISALVNGNSAPAQLDVKTRYTDGSVRFGVITVLAPAVSAQTTMPVMFSSAPSSGTPLSLSSMPGYSFLVDIQMAHGTTYHVDAVKILSRAISQGDVSYWRTGPVVTEGRVSTYVTDTLRLIFDIAKYADGSYSTDVQFTNDEVALCTTAVTTDMYCDAPSGTLVYTTTITQNGTVVYESPSLRHYQYEEWHKVFSTNGTSLLTVQHDVAYLEKIGVIHTYDLSSGVSASTIDGYARIISSDTHFGEPFDIAGLTQYMPQTGGSADIGPTTEYNTVWLLTQDATAGKLARAQADAAAGIPWHFWYKDTWLTPKQVPNVWTSHTAHPGGTTPLLQPIDLINNGWTTDTAHMPSLSYIPYLLTGSRFNLDQLNAQAAFAETSTAPNAPNGRNSAQGLVLTPENQVRAGAWSLREIVQAAWANPDGTPLKKYFTQMQKNNFEWLRATLSLWTTKQGEAYGYVEGVYGTPGALAPWQQDYLYSSIAQAVQLGDTSALSILKWMNNFAVGRFMNSANGFNPRNGVAYNLNVATPLGVAYNTWADIEKATVAGHNANDSGFAAGNYGQLGLATLAQAITVTDSADAKTAYAWLLSAGDPLITTASFQANPTFHIIPRDSVPSLSTPPLSSSTDPVAVVSSSTPPHIASVSFVGTPDSFEAWMYSVVFVFVSFLFLVFLFRLMR